jgi:hypothetical protein
MSQVVEPGTTVITLSWPDYGLSLRYHGWVVTHGWPARVDKWYEGVQGLEAIRDADRLEQLLDRARPAFFVITDLEELTQQLELKELLKTRYAVAHEGNGVLIYDLRKPAVSPGPTD